MGLIGIVFFLSIKWSVLVAQDIKYKNNLFDFIRQSNLKACEASLSRPYVWGDSSWLTILLGKHFPLSSTISSGPCDVLAHLMKWVITFFCVSIVSLTFYECVYDFSIVLFYLLVMSNKLCAKEWKMILY